jgi:hypothetical protein
MSQHFPHVGDVAVALQRGEGQEHARLVPGFGRSI